MLNETAPATTRDHLPPHMCTATRITFSDHWRVVFTRDEQRHRSQAESPHIRTQNEIATAWPRDPDGGGTWIGVNAHGVVLALLNRTDDLAPRWEPQATPRSRGALIPGLLGRSHRAEIAAALTTPQVANMRPFRLLVMDDAGVDEATWDGQALTHTPTPQASAVASMWASSGLGDNRVRQPRQKRFATLVGAHGAAPTAAQQDLFHADQHGDDSAAWVRMLRNDARSVSLTTIRVDAHTCHLTYAPIDEAGASVPASELTLRRIRSSDRPLSQPHQSC